MQPTSASEGVPLGRKAPLKGMERSDYAGGELTACSFHEKVCLSRPPWRPVPALPDSLPSALWWAPGRPVHVAIRLGLLSDARARRRPALSCNRSLPIGRWRAGVTAAGRPPLRCRSALRPRRAAADTRPRSPRGGARASRAGGPRRPPRVSAHSSHLGPRGGAPSAAGRCRAQRGPGCIAPH